MPKIIIKILFFLQENNEDRFFIVYFYVAISLPKQDIGQFSFLKIQGPSKPNREENAALYLKGEIII